MGWGGCYGLGLGLGIRDGVRVKVWGLGEGYQEEKDAKYASHHSRDQGALVIALVIGACLVRVRVRVRLGVSPTLTWAQNRTVTVTLTITLVGRFAL